MCNNSSTHLVNYPLPGQIVNLNAEAIQAYRDNFYLPCVSILKPDFKISAGNRGRRNCEKPVFQIGSVAYEVMFSPQTKI